MKRGEMLKGKVRRARWRLAHAIRTGASAARRRQARKTVAFWEARLARFRKIQAVEHISDRLWGGCRGVTNHVIKIVGDRAQPGSRKRWATFGNPGSDHHMSQLRADAVDFLIAEAHALADEIARKLGGPDDIDDYENFIITFRGVRYRIQIIAGTHGTGPHLHVGVRRV